MIVVDMDGTLLGVDGKVSPRNLTAIRAAERAGVEVVVATGRRHCYAMRQLRGLELSEENVLISSNGAVTRTL
jgi:HAD superfamily hydrolase (TIGR01484 family)